MSQAALPQPALSSAETAESLFTRNFLVLCISTLLFFESLFLLLAVLPVFIVQELHGTEAQVGVVLGVFALAAVMIRPTSGWLVERWNRKLGLTLGALIYCIGPLLYTVAESVPVMIGFRLFHGLGIALFTTASSVLVADIAPPSRRGEAMGYYGMTMNVAMATGPVAGAALVERSGFSQIFWLSALLALGSLIILPLLSEPARAPRQAPADPSKRASLLSRSAVFPGFIAVCMTMSFGAVLSFLPLFVQDRQLGNPGLYFIVYSIAVIIARPVSGKWSDRFGRAQVIIPGMLLLTTAMTLLAYATSIPWLLSVAALQGLGFGTVQPALMAFCVDRATDQERGPALATLMMAFDIGHGRSAIGLGLLLEQTNFTTMFLFTAGVSLLGAVTLAGATQRQQAKA
jgi:MFS family permease